LSGHKNKVSIEVEEEELPYFMDMLRSLFGVPPETQPSVTDTLLILHQADKVTITRYYLVLTKLTISIEPITVPSNLRDGSLHSGTRSKDQNSQRRSRLLGADEWLEPLENALPRRGFYT